MSDAALIDGYCTLFKASSSPYRDRELRRLAESDSRLHALVLKAWKKGNHDNHQLAHRTPA